MQRVKNTWLVSIQHQEETLLIHQEFSLPPAQQEVWGIPAYLIRFCWSKNPAASSKRICKRDWAMDSWSWRASNQIADMIAWRGNPQTGRRAQLTPILSDLAHLASKNQLTKVTFLNKNLSI